jgi:hypothetical protein
MTNEALAFQRETTILSLPAQISSVIDRVVLEFSEENGIQKHLRWHGADLWMVYADSMNSERQCFITRRVTIGVYSDDSDKLAFIPDIVVTKLDDGRYILPYDKRHGSVDYLSVFELTRRSMQDPDMQHVIDGVRTTLALTWEKTSGFSEDEAEIRLS